MKPRLISPLFMAMAGVLFTPTGRSVRYQRYRGTAKSRSRNAYFGMRECQ
jgi:hypothetical protein